MIKRKAFHMKKKIVAIQGSFDILHWGHVKVFERCKSFGDYLIVFLNSNELLRRYKGREPVFPWEHKKEMIESICYVDEVVQADNESPLLLLKKYDVDVFCIGDEWTSTKDTEIKWISSKPTGEVQIIPRFDGIVPTSKIKKILLQEAQEGYMQ